MLYKDGVPHRRNWLLLPFYLPPSHLAFLSHLLLLLPFLYISFHLSPLLFFSFPCQIYLLVFLSWCVPHPLSSSPLSHLPREMFFHVSDCVLLLFFPSHLYPLLLIF